MPRVLDMPAREYVRHLTTDVARTLDRQYVVRPEWLTEALNQPIESWAAEHRWSHPRALDGLMDLIACAPTRVAGFSWQDYPLPPRCGSFADDS
jgi:hypothetical protein